MTVHFPASKTADICIFDLDDECNEETHAIFFFLLWKLIAVLNLRCQGVMFALVNRG